MAFIAEKIKDFHLDDEDMDYCQFVVAVVSAIPDVKHS
jgi:hypothetical protein